MIQVIRKYTVKGFEVRVIEYNEDGAVEYHVIHNFPGVPGGDWFREYEKSRAIAQAQFLAGWIERQKVG